MTCSGHLVVAPPTWPLALTLSHWVSLVRHYYEGTKDNVPARRNYDQN